ncbi:hypothetical protein F4803DRAFT_574682 [Xylaria telfairii]|nr:hypothetical protein F4803DRAFT_574682 [Xylaria telfairii]
MASNMTPPVNIASPSMKQQMSKNQKRQARHKRKRESESTERSFANEHAESSQGFAYRYEGPAAGPEVMQEDTGNEQLSDKIKLDALTKKTEELQGYVNQLQDAVTISMFQLRDLKKQIAAATATLANTNQ